jgi:hypothetical protein
MADRTVPERVNEFLVRCAGRAYCDHCIQERLGLRWRQQVQLVTATLAVTSGYRRSTAVCCTCEDTKQVTSFIGPSWATRTGITLSLPRHKPGYEEIPPASGSVRETRLQAEGGRQSARGRAT